MLQCALPIAKRHEIRLRGFFTTSYPNSYAALKRKARLEPIDTVFVHGAAGAAGIVAFSTTKTKGAKKCTNDQGS